MEQDTSGPSPGVEPRVERIRNWLYMAILSLTLAITGIVAVRTDATWSGLARDPIGEIVRDLSVADQLLASIGLVVLTVLIFAHLTADEIFEQRQE